MINSETVIPKNWKWVTLDDIGIIVSGGTPSTTEPEFWNGDIPWITPADLSGYEDMYISQGNRSISKIGLEYSSANLLPENSVIFSSRAPIGYVAITKNELATNQGFKNIILPSSLINPKYVYYYLKTVKELAENMASGTTFLELSTTKFKQVPFPLAPIEEQDRIVDKLEQTLSELDYSISKLSSNKQKLTNLKETSIAKIFSSYKFEYQKLDNVFICIDGDRGKDYPKASDFVENGHCLFLSTKNILKGTTDFSHTKYISERKSKSLSKGLVESDDLVITTRGTIGNIALFNKQIISQFKQIRINSGMLILRLRNSSYKSAYFLNYFLSPEFVENVREKTTGTAQPQLPSNILKNINIKIPVDIENQDEIIMKLDKLNEEFHKNFSDTVNIINQIKILKSKVLKDAFVGQLSSRFKTDSNILDCIKEIKKKNTQHLMSLNKSIENRPKTKRRRLSLMDIINTNFDKNSFRFEDLVKINKLPLNQLSAEWNMLLEEGYIKKIYNRKTKLIEFKKL